MIPYVVDAKEIARSQTTRGARLPGTPSNLLTDGLPKVSIIVPVLGGSLADFLSRILSLAVGCPTKNYTLNPKP